MDDADLAGPIIIIFGFATFLLLVRSPSRVFQIRTYVAETFYRAVWTAAIRCHIWDRAVGLDLYLRSS